MGIKGLLPVLQSISRSTRLDKYKGLTAAVDAMAWLHKGIFADDVRSIAKYQHWGSNNRSSNVQKRRCDKTSKNVARHLDFNEERVGDRNEGVDAPKTVAYVIRNVNKLKSYGIEVILVIDGAPLPSKTNVDKKRRSDRKEAFRKAVEAERKGDSRNARKLFARACSISYEIRRQLMIACEKANIKFVMAPHEADAQMSRMAMAGFVDLIVTEDSDLLAYGVPRILFKVDFETGRGDEIQIMRDLASNQGISFQHWTHDMFVYMCILVGCDYCEGIVGMKTAHKVVRMHRTPQKIFQALKMIGKYPNKGYSEMFFRAYLTFRHQRVYCLHKKEIQTLHPLTTIDQYDDVFLGNAIDDELASKIATGKLHPVHHKPWDMIPNTEDVVVMTETPWLGQYKNHYHNSNSNSPPWKKSLGEAQEYFELPTKKDHSDRPPLREITINTEQPVPHTMSEHVLNKVNDTTKVPIHFDDYSSKLVGNKFSTLSRSNTSRLRRRKPNLSIIMNSTKITAHESKRRQDNRKLENNESPTLPINPEQGNGANNVYQRSSTWDQLWTGCDEVELKSNKFEHLHYDNSGRTKDFRRHPPGGCDTRKGKDEQIFAGNDQENTRGRDFDDGDEYSFVETSSMYEVESIIPEYSVNDVNDLFSEDDHSSSYNPVCRSRATYDIPNFYNPECAYGTRSHVKCELDSIEFPPPDHSKNIDYNETSSLRTSLEATERTDNENYSFLETEEARYLSDHENYLEQSSDYNIYRRKQDQDINFSIDDMRHCSHIGDFNHYGDVIGDSYSYCDYDEADQNFLEDINSFMTL